MPVSQRKKNRGVRFTPDQLNYIRNSAATMETQKKSLAEKNARMQELQMEFNPQEKAAVIVKGEVYPGDYDHYRGFLHAGEKYLPVL